MDDQHRENAQRARENACKEIGKKVRPLPPGMPRAPMVVARQR